MPKQSLTLSDIIKRYGRAPALICREKGYNYFEYGQLIENAVNCLKANGITGNERVALLSKNSPHYPPALMALFQVGAVAVPISTRLPVENIFPLLKKINCHKLFIAEGFEKFRLLQKPGVFKIDDLFIRRKNGAVDIMKRHLSFQNEATIIFSSGSSGEPKGALHNLGNHYYSALGSNLNIPLNTGDRWLLSLPLYHVGGIAILFRTLLSGAAAIIPDPELSLNENIEKFKATHISLVSTQLRRLLHDKGSIKTLRGLKTILLGGGPISEPLLRKSSENGLSVFTSYGSTEMASQVCATRAGDSFDLLLTAGRPLKYRQIKIADDEILVKGKTLCKGYAEGDRIQMDLEKGGWFKTGDMGKIDEDGYLTVMGRKDNMFISGGENIHPEEIEQYLLQLPQVERAIVVPVSEDEFGARPAAFIKSTADQKLVVKKIITYLERKLPRFKIPDQILPWPEVKEDIKPNRILFKEIATAKRP